MRRPVAIGVLIACALAPALLVAPSPAPAFDAKQWSEVKRDAGGALLVCAVAACGGMTATVSYRAMKADAVPDQTVFLNAANAMSEQRKANGTATQRLLTRDDSKDGRRHYFVLDQVTYGDGRKEFFATGFLATATGAWSFGSTGPTMQVVAGNYDTLTSAVAGAR